MRGEHRDGDVGIHMLIESVKQNEFALFQEQLAAHGIMVQPRYKSPVIQHALPAPAEHHKHVHDGATRDEITKQRDEITKLREANEVVVGRSKKLCIVLHGLLDVKTTEITKMKTLLTKLMHSLAEKKLQMEELVASNLKLKTINVEALKSRDCLQVKLYNVILEKQKGDVEMLTLQETMQKLEKKMHTIQDTLAKCQKQNTTLVAFCRRVTTLTQNIGVDLMQ